MTGEKLTPEEVVERFSAVLGADILEMRIQERREGIKKNPNYNIWIDMNREALKPAIRALIEIHYPHLAVIAGNDLGESIRLIYHLTIYYGTPGGEYTVTFAVRLPKDDLTIPTISDLIPGAVFSEREKQEFFGISVVDIPDGRRLFLPDDFPEGVYPWRKDETGVPESMVNDLWASKRPTGRPAPAAEEKEACELEGEEGKPAEPPEKAEKEGSQ
jgi:membrane-bound hydrogenase subunit beta